MLAEECRALVGQNDMTNLAGLAPTDGNRAGVRVEVLHLEPHQLAVAGAGLERGAHQRPEIRIAGVDQPLGFGDRQVTHPRHLDIFEWLELAAPSVTILDMTI